MTSELMHQASDVLRARTAFLSGDERAPAVRPEILASWRRSALLGAQPDIPTLPFCAEIDSEDALHVAACSVQIGLGLTDAAPGSMRGTYLAVTDIGAARQELTGRGVKVAASGTSHQSTTGRAAGSQAPTRSAATTRASPTSPTRTATPGCCRRSATARVSIGTDEYRQGG